MSQCSIRSGSCLDEYLSKEEMDRLCSNRLVRYWRALKRTYWANRAIAADPHCFERWKEAKRTARYILDKRMW